MGLYSRLAPSAGNTAKVFFLGANPECTPAIARFRISSIAAIAYCGYHSNASRLLSWSTTLKLSEPLRVLRHSIVSIWRKGQHMAETWLHVYLFVVRQPVLAMPDNTGRVAEPFRCADLAARYVPQVPYMNVRFWSPLRFSELASFAKSASSQVAIFRARFLFSRRYINFKKPKPQIPKTMIAMVTISGVSSKAMVSEIFTSHQWGQKD